MGDYQYFLPTKIIFGRGSIFRLKESVSQFKPRRLLLVAGGHLRKDGTADELRGQFGGKLSIYDPKISKSDIETIDELADFCREEKPDLIIAIGGGTILDTAKAVAILAVHKGSIEDYVKTKDRQLEKEGISLVAVSTTAGTGSEVTPFAVVWDTKNKKKYSLESPLLFPKLALVDPGLTDKLPPEITASTGMDALAQAIEAYWSKNYNPISNIFALKVIRLIFASLEKAVKNSDKQARDAMSQASLFSGLAFSNTRTTICHSVSYPITIHFNVPHGQAVAITLPSFIKYSLPILEKERRLVLLRALEASDEEKAAEKIDLLMKKIGLATKLSHLGIKKENIDIIIREGFHPDRVGNAPKVPSPDELQKILERIL